MNRYPAPIADAIFDPDATIQGWARWTKIYASQFIDDDSLLDELDDAWVPSAMAVADREKSTGHDVVAFLTLFTLHLPEDLKRHVHVGLTSSDLVDNTLFEQLRSHATQMSGMTWGLARALTDSGRDVGFRAGHTHGQIAAPTSWHWQMNTIRCVLEEISADLNAYGRAAIIKTPGPTGISDRPRLHSLIGNRYVASTQVIPRDYLLRWAALYLRLSCQLENLALQIRLAGRADVQEVREGATSNRVGSSSMPTKKNPIGSERVCGLARVVRGQFMALSEEVALWEDRDLTNSSTERVTVPAMAGTVEYMCAQMHQIVTDLQFSAGAMKRGLVRAEVYTAKAQELLQTIVGHGPIEASALIRSVMTDEFKTFHYLRQRVHNVIFTERGMLLADQWSQAMTDYYNSVTKEI